VSTHPRSDRSSQAGFTLIEALIAIVILAIGLMAVSQLFLVATSSNQMGNKGTATATQATEALERLRAIPFANLAAGGAFLPTDAIPACGGAGGACIDDAANDCVAPGTFAMCKDNDPDPTFVGVRGVGAVVTRWRIDLAEQRTNAAGALVPSAYYITVQSVMPGPLGGTMTQALFSTLRTCTSQGCPP
jgi:prepilin-type N-terminal cleavage/methylation domain-containing protein